MNILGLHSGFSIDQHDPGAALIMDGKLIAVCEEERFIGIKNAKGHLPINSILACLKEAKISIEDINLIVHPGVSYPNTEEIVSRYLQHYFNYAPKIEIINHQLAHLASAYYHSNFNEAMCLSYDGYGDQLSGAMAKAGPKGIEIFQTMEASNSLGVYYSLMTSYLGFTIDRDEYKVMGLSAYGCQGIDLSDVLSPTEEGYLFNKDYLPEDYKTRNMYEPFYTNKIVSLLGPARTPNTTITSRHQDIAFATQKQLETCAISIITRMHQKTGLRKLCIAGGVGLNCNANYQLLKLDFIDEIFIQPASSDRGIALGCALYGSQKYDALTRGLQCIYKGPTYSTATIQGYLTQTGTCYKEVDDPSECAAKMLADGIIIAWYQGRSEFGPRALGHRSILADPRAANMKDVVNARIKFREEFRPFAPSVLAESAPKMFYLSCPSPYMTISYPVRPEWQNQLRAVTHVDGTSRIQTVDQNNDPMYYKLIQQFGQITGVPAVLNTSFNVRSQPIVETPLQALATFASSGLDALFIDHFLIRKNGNLLKK